MSLIRSYQWTTWHGMCGCHTLHSGRDIGLVQVGDELREVLGDQSVGDEIGEILRGSKCGVQVGNETREVLGGSECGR